MGGGLGLFTVFLHMGICLSAVAISLLIYEYKLTRVNYLQGLNFLVQYGHGTKSSVFWAGS